MTFTPAKLYDGLSPALSVRPIILCGGSGTRLWPLSRALYPKQLLSVTQDRTMLQATLARTTDALFHDPIIVASEDHRFMVRDQIEGIGAPGASVILEPQGRNTAPAIAIAAELAAQQSPDELLLVMPSDHEVLDPERLLACVAAAIPAALQGRLVTFGIPPTRAETGFGYIEVGELLGGAPGVRDVARFVEKPDLPTAEAFLESGLHCWNGGIFLFQASAFLQELRRLAPAISDACSAAMEARTAEGIFVRPAPEPFVSCPAVSLDYAVLEKTDRAAVVPVNINWSDVGSWDAVWEISPKDGQLNVEQGDVVSIDTSGCLIRSDGDMTVATVGLRDMVVIAASDAVLVVPRARSQDTKLLVGKLKKLGHIKHSVHRQVHRSWGSSEIVDHGDRFETRRIIVKPGKKLAREVDDQRSAHWIVVRGTARITVCEQSSLLQENESAYVPAGVAHRLENPGKSCLHLVEVQCGPYLGDDIPDGGDGRLSDAA